MYVLQAWLLFFLNFYSFVCFVIRIEQLNFKDSLLLKHYA